MNSGTIPLMRNARIKDTHLGTYGPDGKNLLATVGFDFGGEHQGVTRFLPSEDVQAFILAMLKIAGVTRWEDLVGKPVRLRVEPGNNGMIVGVGHFLLGKWLTLDKASISYSDDTAGDDDE